MPPPWPTFTAVPQGTEPPYHLIAEIDTERLAPPGSGQFDGITVEIHSVYRGTSRAALAAAMFQLQLAIDSQPLTAPGVRLEDGVFVRSAISRAGPDGVTYVGLTIFETTGQPAG